MSVEYVYIDSRMSEEEQRSVQSDIQMLHPQGVRGEPIAFIPTDAFAPGLAFLHNSLMVQLNLLRKGLFHLLRPLPHQEEAIEGLQRILLEHQRFIQNDESPIGSHEKRKKGQE